MIVRKGSGHFLTGFLFTKPFKVVSVLKELLGIEAVITCANGSALLRELQTAV